MSVSAKFQLSSWSGSGWKIVVVEGVVEHLATVSNSKKVDLELLWVELSYVGFWQQISGQLL